MLNPTIANNNQKNSLNSILNMKFGEIKNTPQYQQVLKMTYGKSDQEIQQMINQIAQQKGIDLSLLDSLIGNR